MRPPPRIDVQEEIPIDPVEPEIILWLESMAQKYMTAELKRITWPAGPMAWDSHYGITVSIALGWIRSVSPTSRGRHRELEATTTSQKDSVPFWLLVNR